MHAMPVDVYAQHGVVHPFVAVRIRYNGLDLVGYNIELPTAPRRLLKLGLVAKEVKTEVQGKCLDPR